MYTGIVIGCIIGFSYSSKFVTNLNATTCSFLLFYNDVVNGETKTSTPKWLGINSIKKTLSQTSAALDLIAQNSLTAFSANTWTTTDPSAFEKQLSSSFSTYSSRTLDNPNPANTLRGGVTKITPIYIDKFGDYTKNGTALSAVYQEYNAKIKGSISLISDAQQYSAYVTTYINDIKSTLKNIQTNVDSITNGFDQLSSSVVDSMINAQDQVNKSGVTGFLVLFAILIIIAGSSFLCLLLYAICCHVQCLRYFLHIFWNITTIIMIITFLLGGVYGIIGLVGIDGVTVMKYIFGSDNLLSASPKVITDPTSARYVDICINGNGDLSKEFVPTGSTSNYLDKLYQISYTLSTTKATITANKNSFVISQLNSQYTNMQKDITITTDPTLGNNHVGNVMNTFRGWTDSSQNTNQKGCSPSANDVFAQSKDKCPSDYTYTTTGKLGDKNCLVFPEISASQGSSRYTSQTGCTGGNTDFSNVSQAVSAYITTLNKYVSDNTALLNELIANNGNIDQSFGSMATKLNTSLDNISGIITPLNSIFSSVVGDQGIFSIITCNFMKTDLNLFYDQLQNNLAPISSSLGGVIIAVSFMEAISVFFLLIVIFRFREDPSGQNAVPKS